MINCWKPLETRIDLSEIQTELESLGVINDETDFNLGDYISLSTK